MPGIRGWFILMLQISAISGLQGQSRSMQFQFGTHVTRPVQVGDPYLKPGWSHNFWLGVSMRQRIHTGSHLHTGLLFNLANYRFKSSDSPGTIHASLNYLSIPLQMEFALGKKTGLLTGAEPKCYIAGHQFTAEPGNSTRIRYFSGGEQTYAPLNLGLRLGFIYHAGPLYYFLLASGDLLPFRQYGPVDWFDTKLVFGFTVGNITLRK